MGRLHFARVNSRSHHPWEVSLTKGTQGAAGRRGDSLARWVALASAAVLGACASTGGGLTLAPAEGQSLAMVAGVPALTSVRSRGRVIVAPLSVDRGQVRFAVAVENLGGDAEAFGLSSLRLLAGGAPVDLLRLEELERRVNATASAEALTAGALGFARATMYAQAATTTSTLTTPSGAVFTYEEQDAALAALGAARAGVATARARDGIEAHRAGQIAHLRDVALDDAVVQPGAGYAGLVVSERIQSGSDLVLLTVDFAGERHEFRWRVMPRS